MLDADLSDGNLTELTTAITNALRPAVVTSAKMIDPVALRSGLETPVPPVAPAAEDSIPHEEKPAEDETAARPATQRGPRKPPSPPTYKADLLTKEEGDAFREFIAKNPTKTDSRRYLVATLWLRDVKGMTAVTEDDVYTCYRTAKWPLGLSDWGVNFRNHVVANRMQRVRRGEYTLTPVGEAELQTDDTA